MKKLFLIAHFILGICLLTVAQSISPTGSSATWCYNCAPQGWSISANTPSVSQPDWNGNKKSAWVTPLPNPPSAGVTKTFVTGYHRGLAHDIITTNITGLSVGKTYDLEYNVITGKTATTGYAISATLSVNTGSAIVDQITDFAQAGVNLWVNKHITFKAESATALVSFNGSSTSANGGIVGLDVQSIKLLCDAGTSQLKIKNNQLSTSNACPKLSVDLNSLIDGAIPANTEIKWFTNDTHTGVPVQDPTNVVVAVGTDFYAFLYDKVHDCYNTSKSLTKIYVVQTICTVNCDAGTAQVNLITNKLTNTCPQLTVNLTGIPVGNLPSNCGYVWYTNPNHTGPQVTDPSNVGSGTYYAFINDTAWGCFNTDNSTAQVTVTINQPCDTKVTLELKVFLQGATMQSGGVTSMRATLQNYFGPNNGLLPATDPYGSGVSNNDINKTQLSGQVIDWVKVEIRSADDPNIVFESQSLWLRPNGAVVNLLGQAPKFNAQPEAIQIVVRHRNHLAVIGNPIASFVNGVVQYDFTTALDKAYNIGAPPQMVLTKGVWCMWAGDVDGNFGFDSTDANNVFSSNEKETTEGYFKSDIDLNGGMDGTDMNLIYSSMLVQPFSTLATF